MRCPSVSLAVVAVLGGCRIEPPNADAYSGTSSGTAGSSGGSGDDVGSGSGGSSSADDSTLTLGVDGMETAGTTSAEEATGTTGGESSSGVVSLCGDGQLDPGEVCDDGVNDGSYDGCARDCESLGPHCGDGAINGPEACDDGVNDGGYDGCMAGCLMRAEHCGDSIPNGPEACDDGVNDGGYDGCAPGCGMPGPSCGDSIPNGPEACDDGANDGSYGGCMPGCLALAPHCGDGALDGPEACDDGVNDGGYGGCMPECLVRAEHCGDWVVNGPELCDDGLANGSYGSCDVGCGGLGEHCGDGWINGPEVCDDGVNDGAYGNCGLECLVLPEYCGDGIVNGPEECDGSFGIHDGCFASCEAPTSCADIKAYDAAAPDGMYTIDADGGGVGSAPFDVYCNMTIDGGGWQLISVRYQDVGVLFDDAVCTGVGTDCSGTIPDVQLVPGDAPDLLFATTDNVYWLRITGLNPPGADSLLDVIGLERVLEESSDCAPGNGISDDHYCGLNLDTALMVADSSPNFVPRFIALPSQYVRLGGIWLGNGGGSEFHHVISLNYISYAQCIPEAGLQLSDASDGTLGNVTCSEPGALYFKY